MIPEDKIAEIRARTDIVRVIGRVVNLKKAGRSWKGLCPFHGEKTPSFNVHPDKQIYYCFGCHAGGDVFRFLMDFEGRPFPEVARQLAEEAGVELPRDDVPQDPAVRRARELKKTLADANARAARLFTEWLGDPRLGEAGRRHLAERGIGDDIAREFSLGYAPLRNELVRRLVQAGVEARTLVTAGLAASRDDGSGTYERFRGRLMVPIRALDGAVVAFGGRRVEGDHPAKYVNSPETPLYHKSDVLFGLDLARPHIRQLDAAVVVEGYFDVIALHQAGVRNAVATCGTALTEAHARELVRHARDVHLVFDGDAAGQEAAARAYQALAGVPNLVGRVVRLPRGDDPDTYVRAHGAEAFQALCRRSTDIIEFLLDHALADVGIAIEERLAAVERVAPILSLVQEPRERRMYGALVADRLRIDLQTLAARLHAAREAEAGARRRGPEPRAAAERPPEAPPVGRARPEASAPGRVPGDEEALCLLVLDHPALLERIEPSLPDFAHAGLKALLGGLVAEYRARGAVDAAAALEKLDDSRLAVRWRAHLVSTGEREQDNLDFEQAARWADHHLRRIGLAALEQREAALRRRHAAEGVDPLTAARELNELKLERRRLQAPHRPV